MPLLLGCIADDFTGATDLASMLVKGGMTAVQVIGVPDGPLPEADAVVVALKSRTAPVADAVRDSLAALDALRAAGARQILHKYCSTCDSTDTGNIGPVADALLAVADAKASAVEGNPLGKVYRSLRGKAKEHVVEALPALGATLERFAR